MRMESRQKRSCDSSETLALQTLCESAACRLGRFRFSGPGALCRTLPSWIRGVTAKNHGPTSASALAPAYRQQAGVAPEPIQGRPKRFPTRWRNPHRRRPWALFPCSVHWLRRAAPTATSWGDPASTFPATVAPTQPAPAIPAVFPPAAWANGHKPDPGLPFTDGSLALGVTGRRLWGFSQPGRRHIELRCRRRRSWDFPFAVLIPPAGGATALAIGRSRLPLAPHPTPAALDFKGPPDRYVDRSASGQRPASGPWPGDWTCSLNGDGPAIAWVRRAAPIHRAFLPWG